MPSGVYKRTPDMKIGKYKHHPHQGFRKKHKNFRTKESYKIQGEKIKGHRNYHIRGICKIKNCNNKHYGLGYCIKHWGRLKRNGSPFIYRASIKGKLNPNWKGGTAEYPNHALMKKQRLIILIKHPECEKCGEPAIEVHHKDKTKFNHKFSNLMALCSTCHKSFHLDTVGRHKKIQLSLDKIF